MIICQGKLTKTDNGMSYFRHKASRVFRKLSSINIVIYCIDIMFFSGERSACNKLKNILIFDL
jgi:hypothetical protein